MTVQVNNKNPILKEIGANSAACNDHYSTVAANVDDENLQRTS